MAVEFLDKTGLGYFWGKIKTWCNSTFAAIAHTHTSYAIKHSYTTAANQAKAWLRIANANTHQMDTSKPLHVQFLLTAWNPDQPADYYEQWFVDCQVFGRSSGLRIFGASGVPFSQARVLYENTNADIDTNDRPAIDIYLNYVLATACHVEIQEVYNSGWTFLADGVLAASTIPTGFENRAVGSYGSGVQSASACDYAARTRLLRSNITANITLANNDTYRARVLNCTNAITVTVPSLDSDYSWFLIKNFNATSTTNNITIHPSTTSVKIDDSNADIVLKPGEWVIIASKAANSYSLIGDSRWKSQKADKATTLEGYGITDAKIANGTITLGSNSITPLTSVPSHNQASNTITAMTGYSKPSSTSAIVTSDTLNQAIGKLEKAIDDADISNTVHLTGNEFIGGIKEFGNSYYDSTREGETDWESSSLVIRYQNYIKSSGTPSTNKFCNLLFLDKTGTNINWNGRLGSVENSVKSDGTNETILVCYKNEIVDGVDTRDTASICIGYDSNGIKYAKAPSTSMNRTVATDILTRDWISKDTRIVHTSGNETINGQKVFTTDIYLQNTSNIILQGNTSCRYRTMDKNGNELGHLWFGPPESSDGNGYIQLVLFDSVNTNGVVQLTRDTNGQWVFCTTSDKTNTYNLGSAGRKWKTVYAGTGSINTSDIRFKDSITNIPDEILDTWEDVNYYQFKFKDAIKEKGIEKSRYHTGVIAQDLDELFKAKNLDISKYGLFCYDEWDAGFEPSGLSSEDKVYYNSDYIYSIRYEETLCMEAAYQRRKNKILENRISELEKQVSDMLQILQSLKGAN